MPRYFFQIRHKGHLVRDEEGEECSDFEAVQWEAKQSAREIITERIKTGAELDGELIEVHDAMGLVVHSVKLADLIN